MSKIPFVHTNYERTENDNYQTIDMRCVQALVESHVLYGDIVDMCGSHGSGIVKGLNALGYSAKGAEEAFVEHKCDWIITNPPYDRATVNKFAEHALAHIQNGKILGAYFLMRANWDFASSRSFLFDNPFYGGQIRMRFRPWWSEERKAQPIHNYVWHFWGYDPPKNGPKIIYWPKTTFNPSTKFKFQTR